MRLRLTEKQIAEIEKKFCQDQFYQFIRPLCLKYQRTLFDIHLSPEEVFVSIIRYIDLVKSDVPSVPLFCRNFFNMVFGDFLRSADSGSKATKEEFQEAASVITSVTMLFLTASGNSTHATLMGSQMTTACDEWKNVLPELLGLRWHETGELQSYAREYMLAGESILASIDLDEGINMVDAKRLEPYFKPAFKGIGKGDTVNSFEKLILRLQIPRPAKDNARIALMIYWSKHMNSTRPAKFSEWYGIFCSAVGCRKGSYKPNKLDVTETLRNEFAMLL